MSIHVALHHITEYQYDRLVGLGPHLVRLRPAPHSRTPVLSYSLRVEPTKHFINWQQDPHGNHLARLVFPEKAQSLRIEVDLIAEMAVYNPFDFFLESYAEKFPFPYEKWLEKELKPFRETEATTPLLGKFLKQINRTPRHTIDFLVDLNQLIHDTVQYIIRMEPGVLTPEQTLERGQGSCRDSAWLLVQTLRHLGFASRFVSGYLIQLTPDVKPLDGPSGASADFTDLHAWTEVYLPGAGWIGLDATSGLLAGEGHIPLACTPDPLSAAPITGTVDDAKTEFDFQMRIERIQESPRVTKPYSEEQWEKIQLLGEEVDAQLERADVRLTMGGEPTFVAVDNQEAPEWNTTATGEDKKQRATELLFRLKRQFANNGLIHYGQGKWYPGESLPRWAYGCFWRKDGEPLWLQESLIGDERKNYGADIHSARNFIMHLAERLQVDGRFTQTGYEDAWYYMWKERRLPTNVDPLQSNLSNEEERRRIAKIFDRGLNTITGYALPLKREQGIREKYWRSGPWFIRSEHMFLLPGDSPMGFRLPLDSIPWVATTDYPYILPPSTTIQSNPLPPHPRSSGQRFVYSGKPETTWAEIAKRSGQMRREQDWLRQPRAQESASWLIRTALCVEPREGRLYIFLPPVAELEDFIELIAAIEDTAEHLQTPVLLEGYPPPTDPRLNQFKITPDPGVIEVNIHPSSSWRELCQKTNTLYEEAFQSRLATEKFMLDGRHTGTGGGNHILIGGETTLDSPLIRKPHLLRSLVGYWINHPSLSYLFSSLFIGPTSQAPRVDEARDSLIYEMEIAFSQIPEKGETPAWLVDRVFRHLLTDSSGNTHRAEFCIDKLYNPDSISGRLGLLELRAFEMPPHARMSLVQHLLLRALVAKFWQTPYQTPLVRWGTQLHDRFLLPHFVHQDLEDVLEDLGQSGFEFDPAWFAPHFEFRFPLYGTVQIRGIDLEMRAALEPWLVLGEEGAAGGTVRYVDSSVERIQIKTRGMISPRHIITCNGHALPMHPTGTNGEFVAGIRYRAWQPGACLHPTVPVHAPLVIDLVDTWSSRSLGGCVYHVAHPGGRNHTTFPVNAYEAESRRLARFFRFGHTPGKLQPKPPLIYPDAPFTLDLRTHS